MSRNIKNYTILDSIGILTANFTAAVTDICTSAAHGLKNGDMVVLTTTGTLPGGLALATVYWIIEATTNTFKLSAISVENYTTGVGGAGYEAVDITSTQSGGTHTFTMHDIGRSIDVSDFRHCIAAVHGANSCNIDIGFQGSIGKSAISDDAPDFSAASTNTNSWIYVGAVNLLDGAIDSGAADQLSQTGSNQHMMYEININGLKWLNVIMSGWSVGDVTVFVRLFND